MNRKHKHSVISREQKRSVPEVALCLCIRICKMQIDIRKVISIADIYPVLQSVQKPCYAAQSVPDGDTHPVGTARTFQLLQIEPV